MSGPFLDTSFGSSGFQTGTPGSSDSLSGIAIQSDGKIVAVGYTNNNSFAVVRYNTDGSPDSSFGTGGFQTATPGTYDQLNGVAIQSDGKIVAVGRATISGVSSLVIVRYNTDGSLDTGFGTSGYNTTTPGTNDYLAALVILSSGKIVAVGSTNGSFCITRYNADGSLDTSFGTSGYTTTTPGTGDGYSSIALQSDGKFVAGGTATIGGYPVFTLGRYNTDGSLDTGYGVSGFTTVNPGNHSGINSIELQSDGKIIAVGDIGNNFAIGRYNTDGSIDSGFGTSGFNITSPGTYNTLYGVVTQTSGKIIAGGYSGNSFTTVRYNTDGTVDTTYGTSGFDTTDTPGSSDTINAITLDADGNLVVAGYSGSNFAVGRFFLNPQAKLYQTLTFSQSAVYPIPIVSVTQNLSFPSPPGNIYVEDYPTYLLTHGLRQSVSVQHICNIHISQSLVFKQNWVTHYASVSDTLDFDQIVDVITQGILLEQSLRFKSFATAIRLSATSALDQLVFLSTASAYVVSLCRLNPRDTTDYHSGIVMTYPYTGPIISQLTLHNPDFTDGEIFEWRRINRKTRGLTLEIFRDPIWPKSQKLRYHYSALSGKLTQQLLQFIDLTLGQQIDLLDYENRHWTGVLTTPASAVKQMLRRSYEVMLEFEITT